MKLLDCVFEITKRGSLRVYKKDDPKEPIAVLAIYTEEPQDLTHMMFEISAVLNTYVAKGGKT